MSKMGKSGRINLTGTSLDPTLRRRDAVAKECSSPLPYHMASPEAMRTDILETRCIGCRQRIYRSDPSSEDWKVRIDRSGRGRRR